MEMDNSRSKYHDKYVFPAIFDYANDGISVGFPDLPGCLTCGQSDEEALSMAKEALGLHIWGMEKDGDSIPAATPIPKIKHGESQTIVLIEVWMPPVRFRLDNKAVNTTVTLPRWLKDAAEDQKVNFSQVLQQALKDILGVQDMQ